MPAKLHISIWCSLGTVQVTIDQTPPEPVSVPPVTPESIEIKDPFQPARRRGRPPGSHYRKNGAHSEPTKDAEDSAINDWDGCLDQLEDRNEKHPRTDN